MNGIKQLMSVELHELLAEIQVYEYKKVAEVIADINRRIKR